MIKGSLAASGFKKWNVQQLRVSGAMTVHLVSNAFAQRSHRNCACIIFGLYCTVCNADEVMTKK